MTPSKSNAQICLAAFILPTRKPLSLEIPIATSVQPSESVRLEFEARHIELLKQIHAVAILNRSGLVEIRLVVCDGAYLGTLQAHDNELTAMLAQNVQILRCVEALWWG